MAAVLVNFSARWYVGVCTLHVFTIGLRMSDFFDLSSLTLTAPQIKVTLLLLATVGLFVWDRLRYDVVALLALFAAVMLGVVPAGSAFDGFSNPVVVTVAAVLALSGAIGRSGAIEHVLSFMMRFSEKPALQMFVLCGSCMVISAFMNNVGALAIFLPVTLAVSRASGRPASEMLMPLAFSSLLGGLVTLIGTPPNLLISEVRARYAGEPYQMFDFAPAGIAVCVFGLLYLCLIGWRMLPKDRRGKPMPEDKFVIEDYIAELRINAGATVIGSTFRDVEKSVPGNFTIVGLIRGELREAAPSGRRVVREGDLLIVRGEPQTIRSMVEKTGTELLGNKDKIDLPLTSHGVGVVEAVVRAGSDLIGRTPRQLGMRQRYGVNLLALRQTLGHRGVRRMSEVTFQAGDIVVLQGDIDAMPERLEAMGCLPLAERKLQLGQRGSRYTPVIVMLAAMVLVIAGVLPVTIAFLGGVLALIVLRVSRLDDIYESIDGPVLILLGALIPVTEALESTGMTDIISSYLAHVSVGLSAPWLLTVVMVATMCVTPFLNNGATVLLMGPIAAGLAMKSGMSIDPFLMAVAIGASCDFVTPVGHQSNTLVMGPGGYKFTDYWRMGLPLSVMVVIVSVPVLLWAWPAVR